MRLQVAFVCGSQAPGGELVPPNQELAVTVEPSSTARAGALPITTDKAAAAAATANRVSHRLISLLLRQAGRTSAPRARAQVLAPTHRPRPAEISSFFRAGIVVR